LAAKAKNKSVICYVRIGDFYEFFNEDALTVSKALDLTLTTRSIDGQRVPMCGVPYHALAGYLDALQKKGFKTALVN